VSIITGFGTPTGLIRAGLITAAGLRVLTTGIVAGITTGLLEFEQAAPTHRMKASAEDTSGIDQSFTMSKSIPSSSKLIGVLARGIAGDLRGDILGTGTGSGDLRGDTLGTGTGTGSGDLRGDTLGTGTGSGDLRGDTLETCAGIMFCAGLNCT
jgi:hypothetical protein